LGNVSMDDIAAAAGVGKGTLFRRFTDREGLIRALFDDRTSRAWAVVRDLAGDETVPAGGGVPAFVAAVFGLAGVEVQPLIRALPDGCQAETWARWRELLVELISRVGPDVDADFLAMAIFASMRPEIADMISRRRHRDGVLALTARSLGIA